MIKVMILLLVVAFAGLFFVKGPGGEPILTLEDLTPDLGAVEPEQTSEPAKVYKWQDENGVWQFSNQPRDEDLAKASGGETVEYDGDINTMPSVDTSRRTTTSSSGNSQISIPAGLTTVSGDQATQMMDAVNNLQQTVDDRKAEVDKLSRQN